MVSLKYLFRQYSDQFQKWLLDLPKIGWRLRILKYRNTLSLRPGEVGLDFGANVGKITKRLARPGVHVYAYEPDPNAFAELMKNVGGREGVTCINKAVSDHAGRAKIYFDTRHKEDPLKWSIRSSLLADKPAMSMSDFAEVEVVDVAEVLKNIHEPIGVIKMDIEGEEVKVLNRIIDLGLASKARKFVVETHERFPTLTKPTEELREKIVRLGIKNIDLNWA